MYTPPAFAETRIEALHEAIRAHGLATLVTHAADGMIATHLPLMLDATRGRFGTLIGHLARANPQAHRATGEALVIFQGPDGYITPSYYPTKRENAKVVPTWNYAAVHAYGPLRIIDDKAELLAIVTRLTNAHEQPRAQPWAVSDAPEDFIDGMLRAIVGIEVPITRLEGKWKMSQNRPAVDRAGVVSGLAADGHDALAAVVDERGRGA
jgi:transcriptional regulator